jgi:uncharacterized protein (DUF1697 family)
MNSDGSRISRHQAGVYVALLRGINVGGHKMIPMVELRALAAKVGCDQVQSYIQSGNLIFAASGRAPVLEAQLEQAIERRFKFTVPVLVRTAADWARYPAVNPFPELVERQPNHVLLALSKAPLKPGAALALQEYAGAGERVIQAGDALWIYFAESIARSKLTPALLDRLAGSPVTVRNWSTVLKLGELTETVSK